MSELIKDDLSNEAWREYDFGGRVYRINNPVHLYRRPGGTTHRVTTYNKKDDSFTTHCVPAPGIGDCVLRWVGKNGSDGVAF